MGRPKYNVPQSFTLDYNWARMVIDADRDIDRYRWRHWLLSRWRDKWREEWIPILEARRARLSS